MVFWAGSPARFCLAIEGLERLNPGFRARYDIHVYQDVVHLPDTALRRFNQVMRNIGVLLDQKQIPQEQFWDRVLAEQDERR